MSTPSNSVSVKESPGYMVVEGWNTGAGIGSFVDAVQKQMADGWVPQGGITRTPDSEDEYPTYAQALVKPGPVEYEILWNTDLVLLEGQVKERAAAGWRMQGTVSTCALADQRPGFVVVMVRPAKESA